MIFWNKICGFILFFLISCLFSNAQIASLKLDYNNFSARNKFKFFDSTKSINLKAPLSSNFSTRNYGFFCREELKIEKATKIPVRLRLGSLEQCNYYEGKKQ